MRLRLVVTLGCPPGASSQPPDYSGVSLSVTGLTVPEPQALALIGLMLLAFVRHHRRHLLRRTASGRGKGSGAELTNS